MSEWSYRRRLEDDLTRWVAEGVIPRASAESIRGTLRPVTEGVTIATVVGIVGGLLIAAAFLAFVAAHWTAIARPARFAILLAGIAGAYVTGAVFDRLGRVHLADLSVGVGSIIFGAAIALVGQMYHLGDDFAGGMLLWASGALVAAALTGARSALAVSLAAACIWSGMRVVELHEVHLPFVGFWLIAAILAFAWNAPPARHLAALAAVMFAWLAAIGAEYSRVTNPNFVFIVSVSFLLGAGLVMTSRAAESARAFGLTLSNYASFGLGIGLAFIVSDVFGGVARGMPYLAIGSGVAGVVMAFGATVIGRRPGPALAAVSIALALVVGSGEIRPVPGEEPWLAYALALTSMLCLVISGMLDDVRPRVVAGWIELAGAIAAITWAVRGSLLRRAVFLAVSGVVAVALASVLGRLIGKERRL